MVESPLCGRSSAECGPICGFDCQARDRGTLGRTAWHRRIPSLRRVLLHLLGTYLLHARLDPPDVALRVPHAPHTIAKEEVRHLGHRHGPGLERPPVDGIAVPDVQP